MKKIVVYASHPRNSGTELARQIGRMLADSVGASVYFPVTTGKYDDLAQADIAALATADALMVVLNRAAATNSVPRHIVQLELRKLSMRTPRPPLFVVRAEPCPIPELAQGASLALAAPPETSEEEIASKIVEAILALFSGPEGSVGAPLKAYLGRLQAAHGIWSSRYTHLSAEISSSAPLRPLIKDALASAELDALIPNAVAQLSATLHPAWAGTDASTRRTADVRQVLYAHRRLALIGEPGSGKSTTVRSLVADLALEGLSGQGTPPVPILIRVGELTSADIEQAIVDELAPATTNDLEGREIWLILDGLNETTTANAETIVRWIAANPHVRMIVTSRRADYSTLNLALPVAELLPLQAEDIPNFLMRWGLSDQDAAALFWALAGAEAEQIWQKWKAAGETFENFWNLRASRESKAFRSTSNFEDEAYDVMRHRMLDEGRLPGLLDIAANPFLLTLTLAIYNRLHDLPTRRAVLFESYVDALLQHLVRTDTGIDAERAKAAFAAIAGAMNDRGLTSLPIAEVAVLAGQPNPSDTRALLQLGQAASILDVSAERIRFSHQLLQHYFGAFALAEMIAHGDPPSRVWREDRKRWWAPTAWDESAVLLAGLIGHNSVVAEKVQTPWDVVAWITPFSPIVAWRCIEENHLDRDHLRAQVLRRPMRGSRAAPKARMDLLLEFEELVGAGVGVLPHGAPDIAWCEIPAGEFVFGTDEVADLPDFWMARFPITNRQFALFVNSGAHLEAKYWQNLPQVGVISHGSFLGANNPRDTVNWYEALAYCRWLTELAILAGDERIVSGGYMIRLPTEREWEKAARGREGRFYPWGNEFDPTRCNTLETGLRRTSPVGIFPDGVSPYGVEDMAGNVWEWCSNTYSTHNRTSLGIVNRGGSCFRDSMRARTTYRADCLPGYHSRGRGFRVVLAASARGAQE